MLATLECSDGNRADTQYPRMEQHERATGFGLRTGVKLTKVDKTSQVYY